MRVRSVAGPDTLAGRRPSGSPTGGRTHSQHLPRSPYTGIRNTEIRRRSWQSQFLRAADAGAIPPEGRNHWSAFFQPARTQLVLRRDIPRDGPVASHRVQFGGGVGRGLLRQEDRTLTAIPARREIRVSEDRATGVK